MTRSEAEITKKWKLLTPPLVSIVCLTFNHKPFISDAIEGFLMQETDFPFEVIISEDCSNDDTMHVVEAYQNKYPRLIRVLREEKNVGVTNNFIKTFQAATAKYIAYCEGDDYWADPQKLQTQVDFLEVNPEFVLSGHNAFIVDKAGKVISNSELPDSQKRDFEGNDLIKCKAWVPTLSWVFRNVIREFPPEFRMVKNSDSFCASLLGHFGKSKHHADVKPACYRVHDGGVWSMVGEDERLDMQINTLFWLYKYYKRIKEKEFASHFREVYLRKVLERIEFSMLIKEIVERLFLLKKIKIILRNTLAFLKRHVNPC